MSKKLKSRGAIAQIEAQGKSIPNEHNQLEIKNPIVEIDRLARQQLGTTVSPSTKVLMAKLQEDALLKGWKKPKIGELIDEAIKELAKLRGIE